MTGRLVAMMIAVLTLDAGPASGAVDPVLAYVGPGAGLGAVGALLAVLAAIGLGIIGLVLYPLRLLRSWLAGKRCGEPKTETGASA